MRRFGFAIAVAVTSLVLVAVVGVGVALALPAVGAVAGQHALAGPPWMGFGPHGFGGTNFQLPAELQGLRDLPAADRFAHFTGVQVNLKDKDNHPLTVNVIPGTVTTSSATDLTIAANDGTTKSFTLNDKTIIHGTGAQGSGQPAQSGLDKGSQVVVVTLNNDTTAMAVVDGGKDGFGAGFGGPGGWGGWGPRH